MSAALLLNLLKELNELVILVDEPIRVSQLIKAHPQFIAGQGDRPCTVYVAERGDLPWQRGEYPISFRVTVDRDVHTTEVECTALKDAIGDDFGEGFVLYRIAGVHRRFIKVYND
jgi:hypothetical protein